MRTVHLFKRSSASFGTTPDPVTPYQKAAQVWDERMGSARAQAKNWRLMALGCMGLLITQGTAMIWLMHQNHVVPYVVELEHDGTVHAVGSALANWQPSDAQIARELARFITSIRGLPSDPIVVRQNWLEAYESVTPKAAASLSDYATAHDPFGNIGKRTVTVDLSSVVRAGPNSFELRWSEHSYDQGRWTGDASYTAMFGVKLQTPTTEEAIRKNPLGLYIDDINWSKDLTGTDSGHQKPDIRYQGPRAVQNSGGANATTTETPAPTTGLQIPDLSPKPQPPKGDL